MKPSLGADVLSYPTCASRLKVRARLLEPEVIEKILVPLNLPLRPEQLQNGMPIVYDVTGEPAFDEVWYRGVRGRRIGCSARSAGGMGPRGCAGAG